MWCVVYVQFKHVLALSQCLVSVRFLFSFRILVELKFQTSEQTSDLDIIEKRLPVYTKSTASTFLTFVAEIVHWSHVIQNTRFDFL
jgi:hypothetical protein